MIDVLQDGANQLIKAKQFQSGADLALLLIESLQKCRFEDCDFGKWAHILANIIETIESSVVERETLIVRAVKWSCDYSKNNQSILHRLIANIYARENEYEKARQHFLLSRDGVGCAKILIQLSAKAFASEVDLIIVQVVLNLLILKEKDTALVTFNTFTKLHPKIQTTSPPYRTPLLNFIYFLLILIDDPQLQAFQTLCELYKTALSRDVGYEKQLQTIGVSYFGAAPVRQQRMGGGLFGDLFNQLFQELEATDSDSGDDDYQTPPTSYRTGVAAAADLD